MPFRSTTSKVRCPIFRDWRWKFRNVEPENWAPAALEPFRDVASDPVRWATKCVDAYGAEILCLRLVSADPLGGNASPAAVAETVSKVASAVDVRSSCGALRPKGRMRRYSRKSPGYAPQESPFGSGGEGQLCGDWPSGIGTCHAIVAQASMDANLTKELNIALCKFFPPEKIVLDPTSSALGYGSNTPIPSLKGSNSSVSWTRTR